MLFQRTKPLDLILETASKRSLTRQLGAFDLTMLGIGAVIGTGIFVLTAVAANKAGPGMMYSFIIAGIVCALTALIYSEIAAMVPVSGSAYTYSYAVLGELIAWMVGWALILEYAVAAGAVSVGWSGYANGFLHAHGMGLPHALTAGPFDTVTLPDGTTAYTRDGSFQKDNQGQIVTSDGFPVQPNITIPANALSLTIGQDGTVSITQPGTAATTQIGSIQVATFINPAGLQSVGQNLFLETAASGTPTPNTPGTNGAGIVSQGYVETSNVNVAEELVTMIQTQRAYELNSKVVSTSDAMLGRLTQL